MKKQILPFALVCLFCYSLIESGLGQTILYPDIVMTKEDSMLFERYYELGSSDRVLDTNISQEQKADLFALKIGSAIGTKKIKLKQPLSLDSLTKIAIIGCRPSFSSIDDEIINYCSSEDILESGSNISHDISHLLTLFLRIDFKNENWDFINMDDSLLSETPIEPINMKKMGNLSINKNEVRGTQIWGTNEFPDCTIPFSTGNYGVKVKKDQFFINLNTYKGEYNYILGIWPCTWSSSLWDMRWMYYSVIAYSLIDGNSGEILWTGYNVKSNYCDKYCGMEMVALITMDIEEKLVKLLRNE